jgi:exodeoxyribonuclease VIII
MNNEKNRIDIMLDIETLGKGDNPPVFQIAGCAFDITTGEIIDTINKIANIRDVNNIEGDTLLWWLNNNSELLKNLLNKGCSHQCTEKDIVMNFVHWVNSLSDIYNVNSSKVYLWGNGATFDNRIIEGKCRYYGFKYPISYYADRDMRTIIEAARIKKGFSNEKEYKATIPFDGTPHDALNDTLYQIKVICQAYKDLGLV